MVEEIKAQGFDDFMNKVASVEKSGKIVLCMFCGDKDASGNSWCPDCVKKEPVVKKAISEADGDKVVFIYCTVGGRDYWKNRSNEFRTHAKLKLTGVPTLLVWGTQQKSTEDNISADVISMMLEEED